MGTNKEKIMNLVAETIVFILLSSIIVPILNILLLAIYYKFKVKESITKEKLFIKENIVFSFVLTPFILWALIRK